MKRRWLSILLVCGMVLTMLPSAAFAEGGEPKECVCTEACTAETQNADCPICGAEDAVLEDCAQYETNQENELNDNQAQATPKEGSEEEQTEEIPEEEPQVETQVVQSDKPVAVQASNATHKHCYCGGSVSVGDHTSHTNVSYQAWNGTDSISFKNNTAYVSLTQNATCTSDVTLDGKTLYLCLNGKTLSSNGAAKVVLKNSAKLILCDCAGGGIVQGSTASSTNGGCVISYGGTISIYGGTITGGKASNGGAIASDKGGSTTVVNLYGGEISGNSAVDNGGAIYLYVKKDKLNIYGGTISGNKSSNYGGAVYVNRGTVNMSGGTISGNTAGTDIYHGYGGAICLMFEGSVNMSGGEIVDNHAYRAGGIYGSNNASGTGITMTISGGRITENTASETVKNYGAGVWNSAGTTILKGNPYIRGNYAVLNGTVNNGYADLYYENGKKLLQVEKLTEGADIGITIGRSKKPTEGSPIVFSEACDKNYSRYFTSNDGYSVGYNTETKRLELRVPCKHSNGTLQWTTTPTTHEQAWSCCGLVTVAETAHTWENGKCTVCEYACLHDGGTATCTKKAVCDICGGDCGTKADHSFTAETVEEDYLKSVATCTAKAVYYKSCSVCGLSSQGTTGEDTFESGEVDANNHTGKTGDWQSDAEKHWKEYSCCQAKAEEAEHVYTDSTDTTCDICGYTRETEVKFNSITAVGNGEGSWLNGVSWGVDSDKNHMTETASGSKIYEITYTNVDAYDAYAFKFAANGNWTDSWGADYGAGLSGAAVYNSQNNIVFSVDTDNSTVKLVLDLSKYDHVTKQGATYTITITSPHTHNWSSKWTSDDTHHWHECTANGCDITDNANQDSYGEHTGGTATCLERAKCATCGEAYGDLADHSFTAEVADEQYLKSEATCTKAAVYYKSCAVCGLASTETFVSGDPLGHDYSTDWSQDDTHHWHVCSRCDEIADLEAHTASEWITDTAATAKSDGEKHTECTVCGYILETDTIPATGSQSKTDKKDTTTSTKRVKTKAPKTGDNSNLILWTALLCASGFGVTGIILYSRKRKDAA